MKGALYFVAGMAVGAGVSYYLTKDIVSRKKDEEKQSMARYYMDQLKMEQENAAERFKETQDAKEAMETYRKSLVLLSKDLAKDLEKDSVAVFNEDDGSEPEEDDEEDEIDPADYEYPREEEDYFVYGTREKEPYSITEEQWAEEGFGFFDKITLVYYLKDDMLLAEDGGLIEDIYKVIGKDWEEDLIDEGDETFVRNELVGADYYIIAKDEYGEDNMKEDYSIEV